jgi:hypothetical protein
VLVVRESPGWKMKTIVNALEKRFPGGIARDQAAAWGGI